MPRITQRGAGAMVASIVVVALVTGACSGNDDADQVAADFAEMPADMESPEAAVRTDTAANEAAGVGEASLVATNQAVPAAIDDGRDIIFTAELAVAVTDVTGAGREAVQVVESLGGFLFGQRTIGGSDAESVLVFKVHPADFPTALDRLGELGEIRTQNVFADDVTERVVDLESRISTAEASVARLNGFLEEATDIKQIAELEAQLLERETLLETLRGQLRTVQDRVDLATITLTLTEALSRPAVQLFTTGYEAVDGAGSGCPGIEQLAVLQDAGATICFEISNEGDAPLTAFEITDPVLNIELADLIVVFGDPNQVLEPGQSMILATETTVARDTRLSTTVSAAPVDADGAAVETKRVSDTMRFFIVAEDPGGMPGFDESLDTGLAVVLWMAGVAVVVAGLAVPLLPLAAIVLAAGWWLLRRRKPEAPAAPEEEPRQPAGIGG